MPTWEQTTLGETGAVGCGFAESPENHTTSDEVRADLAVKQNESSGLARKGKWAMGS